MAQLPDWAVEESAGLPDWAVSTTPESLPDWAVQSEPAPSGVLAKAASAVVSPIIPQPASLDIPEVVMRPLKTLRDAATSLYMKSAESPPELVKEKGKFIEGIGDAVSKLTEKAAGAGLPDWAVEAVGTGAAVVATPLQMLAETAPTSVAEGVALGAATALGAGAGPYAVGLAGGAKGAAQVAEKIAPEVFTPAPASGTSTAWLYQHKQELARSINAQKVALENFVKDNAGKNTKGFHAEYQAKLAGLQKDQQSLADTVSEVGRIRAEANASVQQQFGPGVSEAAAPRLVSMPAEDVTRNMAELTAARKAGLVKPIPDAPTTGAIDELFVREGRPRTDSEVAILGLRQNTEALRQTANAAIADRMAGRPISREAQQQVMVAVSEAIRAGEFTPQTAAKLLGVPELASAKSRAELAQRFLEVSSQYGTGLAQLSRIAREMETVFGNEPAVKAVFDTYRKAKAIEPWTLWQGLMNTYRYADNIRRASMVSGIATTARNIVSQGERALAGVFEDAVAGGLGVIRGQVKVGEAMDLAAADLQGLVNAVTPKGRAQIEAILSRFPIEKERLLGTPIGDVTLGSKASRFLNTLNTYQEYFFRRAAFDAHLRQTMALGGKTVEQLTAKDIMPAVKHALEMTYSASPETGFGRGILNLYKSAPWLTAIGNPFPRFWLNAVRRLGDMSGVRPLLGENLRVMLASSDPRVAGHALGKFMEGVTYAGAGFAMAEAGVWGEKWYEAKVGNKTYDLRPYSPVLGPLFAGRMIYELEKEGPDALLRMTPDDYIQATLSMKRTDATGVPLFDIGFSRSEGEFKYNILKVLTNYASSFVPRMMTSARDIVGVVNQEERIPRYTKSSELLGKKWTVAGPVVHSAMAQVPFWDRMLLPSPSLMRAQPEERVDPALRVIGFAARIKTPAESEADKLGIMPRNIYPKTGNPDYDRLIVERMGPYTQDIMTRLISIPVYMQQTRKVKKAIYGTVLGDIEQKSRSAVRATSKEFTLHDMVDNKERIAKELIKKAFDQQGIQYEWE